jgi:HK97 gp10 family phage protein
MARRKDVGIEVEGLDDLSRALRRAGDFDKMREFKEANIAAAKVVSDESKVHVPVRTGRLQRSIKAKGTARGSFVEAGTPARAPYANPIHWGWARRGIKPQPFIYEAYDKRIAQVKEAYNTQLRRASKRLGLAD